MHFDEIIDRRGTHCVKWDRMEKIYGVPADNGIAMWVADMDFRPPQVIQIGPARHGGSRHLWGISAMTAHIAPPSSGG